MTDSTAIATAARWYVYERVFGLALLIGLAVVFGVAYGIAWVKDKTGRGWS